MTAELATLKPNVGTCLMNQGKDTHTLARESQVRLSLASSSFFNTLSSTTKPNFDPKYRATLVAFASPIISNTSQEEPARPKACQLCSVNISFFFNDVRAIMSFSFVKR